MPQTTNSDTELYWLIGIAVVLLLTIAISGLVSALNGFTQELKRLNNEIGRTHGTEREHYIKRRRRLWLSLLPFVKY